MELMIRKASVEDVEATENNVPAIRLYEKHGFAYRATIDMGLGDIGLKWFKVFEKLL